MEKAYYAGTSEEYYSVGPCATMEEAIEELKADNEDEIAEGEITSCWVGELKERGITVEGESFWERLVEDYDSDMYEGFFERAMDAVGKDAYKELGHLLTGAVQAWAKKHDLERHFHIIDPIKEVRLREPVCGCEEFDYCEVHGSKP